MSDDQTPQNPQWNQPPPPQGPPPQQHNPAAAAVPDYLVWSILTLIFCCQPLGIAGLIYSVLSNSKKNSGDIVGATADAKMAKKLLWWGFGVGAVIIVLVTIFYIVAIVIGVATNDNDHSSDLPRYDDF